MQDPDDKQPQPINAELPVQPSSSPDTLQPQDSYTPGAVPSWFSEQSIAHDPLLSQPVAPKPRKKGLVVALLIFLLLAILGGAGMFAYNYLYQNPEKVVTDSLMNAIKARSVEYSGSYVMTSEQKLKIEVTGKSDGLVNDLNAKISFHLGDENFVVSGGVFFDKNGDSYVKLKNAHELAAKLRVAAGNSEESNRLLDAVVAKVNNRWIKTSGDELYELTSGTASVSGQECLGKAADKVRNDESTMSELIETYKKHKFIIIDEELGEQDGSLGYVITVDEKLQEGFEADFKKTQLYKTLVECDDRYKISDKVSSEESGASITVDATTKLWVSRWSHEITKIDFDMKLGEDGAKHAVTFKPTFNQVKDSIKTPDNSITLKQLQAELEELYQAAMPNAPNSFNESTNGEL